MRMRCSALCADTTRILRAWRVRELSGMITASTPRRLRRRQPFPAIIHPIKSDWRKVIIITGEITAYHVGNPRHGAWLPEPPRTESTMRASRVVSASAVTQTVMAPFLLIVPANTLSPLCFATCIGSPVSIPRQHSVALTQRSVDTFGQPGFTRTMSPAWMSLMSTRREPPQTSSTVALDGCKSISERMADDVLFLAFSSSVFLSAQTPQSSLAESKYTGAFMPCLAAKSGNAIWNMLNTHADAVLRATSVSIFAERCLTIRRPFVESPSAVGERYGCNYGCCPLPCGLCAERCHRNRHNGYGCCPCRRKSNDVVSILFAAQFFLVDVARFGPEAVAGSLHLPLLFAVC